MPPVNAPLTPDADYQVPAASIDFQGQKGDSFTAGLGVNIQPNNNIVAMNVTTVVVATQSNVNLASALANGQTVDGVSLVTGQLVLVKAQTLPAQNGVYVVPSTGAASRSTAFGAYGLFYHRKPVKVLGGTSIGQTYLQATRGAIVVGTTAVAFELFRGQLENQADISVATTAAMQRHNVSPSFSQPHERVTEGIRSPDNQGLEGFYPVGNVRVATTAAIALTGLQTIDGVAVAVGDRVLVKNGTTSPALYTAVDAATTANIADLANASVAIDGVTLIETNRLLVKDQTLTKDNGIYVVGAVTLGVAALTRATDMDATNEVILDKGVDVTGGTANGGKTFLVSAVPASLGTDPLTFALTTDALVADEVNGVYVAASSTWARATDADTSAEVKFGMMAFVKEGTVNGKNSFYLKTANPIILGSTPLVFGNLTEVLTENFKNRPLDTIQNTSEGGAYRSL